MSGFSASWLGLREPFDAAARSAELLAVLVPHLPTDERVVVDLGAGTGSNLRYSAPRLGGRQRWLLVDADGALLRAAEPALLHWASDIGASAVTARDAITILARDFSCEVRRLQIDLAEALDSVPLAPGALVTCSALLDLASAPWIDRLAAHCAAARAAVAFALTYDGLTEFAPEDPLDAKALELFNAHQRTDKSFGPALGPDAVGYAERQLTAAGYTLATARSDWHARQEDRELQHAILDGWHGAASEIAAGERRPTLAEWRARRAALIDAGRSTLRVGHIDLVGWM